MTKLIDNGGIHDTLTAYKMACRDYTGGLPVMAVMLGISLDVLRKKLDAKVTTHQLQEREAMLILNTTRDSRILDSICSEADVVWVEPSSLKPAPSDMDVLKTSTSLMDGTLCLIDQFHKALEDGVVTPDERAVIDKRLMELHQRINSFDHTARQFEG